MTEKWKIVGKNGAELIQCSFEEGRVMVRCGPPADFHARLQEPPEAPITMPTREMAEALATVLRQTTIELLHQAKVIRC